MGRNIDWIEPFTRENVNVFGDYALILYHSADFLPVSKLGICEAVISHEGDLEGILTLDLHGVIPEMAFSARIPSATSEN